VYPTDRRPGYRARDIGGNVMMLEAGQWLGRGSLLEAGDSLGRRVECEVTIETGEAAFMLSGRWSSEGLAMTEFTMRLAQNDTGIWTVMALAGGLRLQGSAKLESPPNLALLWNDRGTLHLTIALFAISGGYGCRGFMREDGRLLTWELAFRRRQEVVGGPNVVSLRSRRPR